jgi:hypothetical protein
MRRLTALRVSLGIRDELLAPGPLGTVAGVHPPAINLLVGRRIVTIASEAVGGLPNGLTVRSPLPLDRLGIRPGMQAYADGASLFLPAASLRISIAGARGWSPTMPDLGAMPAPVRAHRATLSLRVAAESAPQIGLGPLIRALASGSDAVGSGLVLTAGEGLADIVEMLGARRAGGAVERAAPLIGLGPGATPSGDDLLVGLAAGLAAICHPLATAFARGVADAAAGRTTALAETFLWHAGRGEFADRVQRTAAAIHGGDPEEMQAGVHEALRWGASSGADLLVGLLVGIQADAAELPARLRAAVRSAVAA